jgi:hypothetical protein
LLDAADALAAFADLEPAGVATFRQRYPDFAPASWWEYQSDSARSQNFSGHWQLTQTFVREAWTMWLSDSDYDLPLFGVLRILTSVFDPNDLVEVMLAAKERPAFANLGALDETPFHKAVQFLVSEPWRAKTCQEPTCGKRFVADHASRKYCSTVAEDGSGEKCSAQAIKRQHLKWGKENNWGRQKSKRR